MVTCGTIGVIDAIIQHKSKPPYKQLGADGIKIILQLIHEPCFMTDNFGVAVILHKREAQLVTK